MGVSRPAMAAMENPQIPQVAETNRPRVVDFLAVLDARLAETRWLAGDDFSIADVDGLVAMDLSALLQQAQRLGEAIAVFEQAAVADPPDYALLAAARAYRDVHRYRDAEKLAQQGFKRFPDQTVWPLLLALVRVRNCSAPPE